MCNLSGCFILWQQPVKMYHLSSGSPFMYTLFVNINLAHVECVCVCVCVCVCHVECV